MLGTTVEPVLDVRRLSVTYRGDSRNVRAARDVSFSIAPGEVFGLAGESGCGKSTVANAVMRLLRPPAEISAEALHFRGRDILALSDGELRAFRWREVAMVFQSAMNSLNPVMTVGDQIIDIYTTHERIGKREARERAADLLRLVDLKPDRLKAYPHQLSGGMRQRVVIAMAVALRPELLIMDEPTTALDVVVQQEIMYQIKELQRELGFSVLFITHDMSLMLELSDRIGVMYGGCLVEVAAAKELHAQPLHPYTEALLNAFPPLTGPRVDLTALDDTTRAAWAGDIPDLCEVAPGRWVAQAASAEEGSNR
jgi:peptide/nickel transport system ATP-binding protein